MTTQNMINRAYNVVPTATTIASWDANKNMSAVGFIPGYSTTVTSSGTSVLTVGSNQQQYFTGSTTGQIVQMPVTNTCVVGQYWSIVNNSTAIITIQSSGGNTILALPAASETIVTCILASGTTAASWTTSPAVSGSGTVSSGTQYNLAYYANNGTTVSGLANASSPGLALLSGSPDSWSTNPPITKRVKQVFTSGGAYTPTAGMVYAWCRLVAGGGAGGGTIGVSGQIANGSGGGGGAYSEALLTAAQIGASQTVTIGAGGIGSTGNGTNGSASSLGTLLTANGGSFGSTAAASATLSTANGGVGGTAGTGDISIPGMTGGNGVSNGLVIGVSGAGGNSLLGAGGNSVIEAALGAINGVAGSNYGAGGSGGVSLSLFNSTGGNGAPGVLIIEEYISV